MVYTFKGTFVKGSILVYVTADENELWRKHLKCWRGKDNGRNSVS